MKNENAKLNLSPSLNHKWLADHTKRALAYDGGDVKKWQAGLRRKLLELLGETPGKRPPLRVRSLWKQKHELGSMEKIAFASEPMCDATAYVCLPKTARPPYNFFICVQGHSTGMHNSIGVDREDETKKIEVPGDRDFALGCMRRGVAALCLEQRSFGERRERDQANVSDRGCFDAAMHALMLGRTLLGERIYDIDRAIDYLESRGDVNMRKLGVMGNSGGGTASMFAAAALPRIRLAMPSCYFCTFRDSIMAMHHCECNYVPGLLRYAEMADIMGLFAPRPVVIVAGKTDPIFPIKGVLKSFKALKRIYRAAGAEQNCLLAVGPEGHRFYAEEGWKKMLPFLER